jgi:hypothetical protein
MKIYKFFLKRNEQCVLYAYTDNKLFRDKFIEQRDSDSFIYQKYELSSKNLASFEKFNKLNKMTEIILEDGSDTFSIIGTIQEENELSYICSRIYFRINYIKKLLSERLNEHYALLISQLMQPTKTVWYGNDKNSIELNLNTYNLFYKMYDFTFNHDKPYHELDTMVKDLGLLS